MQAFANNVTEELDKKGNSIPLDSIQASNSLFSPDDIIFPDNDVDRPYVRYGYKIADMNFLVPEGMVSEVIQTPNIFNLPNSPAWIEGLINIRGNIVPVMNINKFLNNKKTDKQKNILILNKSDSSSTIAIVINGLPVSLEHNDSKPTVSDYSDSLVNYIEQGFHQNNADWVEFNPHELFKKLADKSQ